MTGARIPGFTAENSLGIFAQEYHHLVPSESHNVGIIPTFDFGPYAPTQGCCCRGGRYACNRPCVPYRCDSNCCCLVK